MKDIIKHELEVNQRKLQELEMELTRVQSTLDAVYGAVQMCEILLVKIDQTEKKEEVEGD